MRPVFPATYSTLSPEALSSVISEKYDLGKVRCKFLVRGVGDTYLVESARDRYIARVYRSSHRSLSEIEGEVELLSALRRQGVSVSYPIADRFGAAILNLDAVEGVRRAVLFSYAAGEAVKVLNKSQLRLLGREMARFHNVSSAIELNAKRWEITPDTILFKPLQMLKPAFAGNPEDYAWLERAARRVQHKVSTLDMAALPKGYCHFDFLPKNLHFEGDTITIFDFDFMGYGWLLLDMVSFWQHLELEVYAGRMAMAKADDDYTSFLDGYRECRSVSESQLAIVPYLTLGFWLFYMSFHTTHDQFYAFVQPAPLKAYVGFLRSVGDKYWDDE